MPHWEHERRQMTFLFLIISNNPCSYLLGMFLLGVILGISLLFNPPKKQNISAPKPQELKTATENVKWGYLIMNTDGIMQSDLKRRQTHCKQALPYFKRAILLDSQLGLAYQGQGMSLICQNNMISGRNSLRKARSLYLKQGNNQDIKEIDLILKIYK